MDVLNKLMLWVMQDQNLEIFVQTLTSLVAIIRIVKFPYTKEASQQTRRKFQFPDSIIRFFFFIEITGLSKLLKAVTNPVRAG